VLAPKVSQRSPANNEKGRFVKRKLDSKSRATNPGTIQVRRGRPPARLNASASKICVHLFAVIENGRSGLSSSAHP
jgi:hypothetical protein